jgi:Nif-specific regulatory protein
MQALLTIEAEHGEPKVYTLHPEHSVTLGRHRQNIIVLNDEHASRWHAEVFQENGHWIIRDFGALNGTRINGKAIKQQAVLEDGSVISIGKTSLRFSLHVDGANGTATTTDLPAVPLPAPDTNESVLNPIEVAPTILCKDELTALCQFMAASVRESDPRALIERALEMVHHHTGASASGFLSLDRDEPLPKMVLPKLARVDIHLSRRLTKEVEKRGKAVWLGMQPDALADSESLLFCKDALCVPLLAGETPLGALHVYKSGKLFTEREVRFCEVLAGHLANSLHLLRVRRTLEAENSRLRHHSTVADQLIGSSPQLEALRQRIGRLAPRPSTVLIVGESGVGKELVALALHSQSSRREGPLVCVNCAAISPTLLESELFGHSKGAFTNADCNHPGLFQQADEGTLFLDEVGELSLECQAKLLRVLETKSFRPVGGTAEVKVNVRTIAATNRNLEQEVEDGRFRGDLFYRLQGIQIQVLPLREHIEDLGELVDFFLKKLALEWGRTVRLTEAALQRLREYSWPGNVRQLRSVLENAVGSGEKDILGPEDLALTAGRSANEPPCLNLEQLECWAIRKALRQTGGNISQAARVLGIVRDTLSSKMRKYGIDKEGV